MYEEIGPELPEDYVEIYYEEMDGSSERTKGKRDWLVWIGIILVILLFFFLVRINIEQVEERDILVEYERDDSDVPSVEITTECSDREYNWAYLWEGWRPQVDNTVSPILTLTNQEDKPGNFKVYYAFFDSARYYFDDYSGKTYEEVRLKLPWEAASMYSYVVNLSLGPGESGTVVAYTEKANEDAIYWAYADIQAPTLEECEEIVVETVPEDDANVLKCVSGVEKVRVSSTIPLWQWLWRRIR